MQPYISRMILDFSNVACYICTMKVLLLNGSPHKEGNTHIALGEVAKALNADGIETEILWIGNKPIPGCIACYKCYEAGVCVFNTGIYEEIAARLPHIDGIVVGSPTYYAGPNGSLCALLDRVFYSLGRHLRYKPAAAIGVARRGGVTCTVDRLNKYFEINNMPMPNSQYWNMAFGREPGEVLQDQEGMQTMRILGHNMARLLNALKDSPIPAIEPRTPTNFIR